MLYVVRCAGCVCSDRLALLLLAVCGLGVSRFFSRSLEDQLSFIGYKAANAGAKMGASALTATVIVNTIGSMLVESSCSRKSYSVLQT